MTEASSLQTDYYSEQNSPAEVLEASTWDLTFWLSIQKKLVTHFDSQIFSAYIAPLGFVSFNEGYLVLAAPSNFLCTYLERSLKEKLLRELSAVVQSLAAVHSGLTAVQSGLTAVRSVSFVVNAEKANSSANQALLAEAVAQNAAIAIAPIIVKKLSVSASGATASSSSHTNHSTAASHSHTGRHSSTQAESPTLNPRYTFDNFVVGKSNEFCHAAAMRVAENPGKSYNPLFIYGGVGLGKTHLLHAIGNAVRNKIPDDQIMYLSSEGFTNELIQALRNDKMDEFKRRLRGIHLLLIDDIQFISGKERTQEEFFHTFNALYSAKRQIVITSDKMPQDIRGLEERLHTRFSWGLTADLQSPDFETRVAIIKRKAALESLNIPEDVTHLISQRIKSNVRELEGALTRLLAVSSMRHSHITMELAHAALAPLLSQNKRITLSIDDIKRAVSVHFKIKASELISKRRTKSVAFPRHVAMYLCRKHTSTSYPEIGGHFGGRDHSSVIHAANVISMKVASDPEIRDTVKEIEQQLVGNQ